MKTMTSNLDSLNKFHHYKYCKQCEALRQTSITLIAYNCPKMLRFAYVYLVCFGMFCVTRFLVFHIPFNQSTRNYDSKASKCHFPVFPHFIDLLLKWFQNVILKVSNNLWLNNVVSFRKMFSLFEIRTWFEPVVTSRSSCWCVPTSRQSRSRSRHSKVRTPWHRFNHYLSYTLTSVKYAK